MGSSLGRKVTYTEADFFWSALLQMESATLVKSNKEPTVENIVESISNKLNIGLSDDLIELIKKIQKEIFEV